ncbi:MAG: septal ring lytic transglycosylase RlpA family protein [Bacteroidaceae bacterium]|nr:septal ring lytic transglycosylase RlpA family protein [Bacteroidaceae bacterium]
MIKIKHVVIFTISLLFTLDFAIAQKQVGKATYYHNRFHGRRTSNGEIYHRDSFTCAHKTLPFGTMVRVRDTRTDKEVTVKVNDRLGHGTMIDLSYAAARELGIVGRGTTTVEIEPFDGQGIRMPNKPGDLDVPQIKVRDPLGNGYCLLSEWGDRYNKMKLSESLARNAPSKNDSIIRYDQIEQ